MGPTPVRYAGLFIDIRQVSIDRSGQVIVRKMFRRSNVDQLERSGHIHLHAFQFGRRDAFGQSDLAFRSGVATARALFASKTGKPALIHASLPPFILLTCLNP